MVTRNVYFLLMIVIWVPACGQRAFVATVGQQARSYTIVHISASEDAYNLPLLILIFNDESKTPDASGFSERGVIVATPSILQTATDCSNAIALENDIAFLSKLIDDTYQNFRIDRNRIYIVSRSTEGCLADSLATRKPGFISKHIKLFAGESLADAMTRARQPTAQSPTAPKYELWKNPLYDPERAREAHEDSIRLYRWERRTTIEFRMGRFDMLGVVRTPKDKTYMDVADAHTMMDLHINHWMSDSMAWFVDIGRLRVPQRQEFNGARIEMGGGTILSLSWGLKYTFHRHNLRPYITLATGPLSFLVFGGKFSLNTDPQQARSKIKAEVRTAMQTKIGTGIEGRIGKRICMGAHVAYIHSSQFKSAGSVNAVRGFYNSLSVGYIMGANKIQ